jgi:hypothetical protein
MATTIAAKKYLVDALNENLAQLYVAFAKEGKGRRVGALLQHAIETYADEETLTKILADVRQELASIRGEGSNA